MIKAVIVEDESFAAQNLQKIIETTDKNIEIIKVLQSVEDSIEWFNSNKHPELVFMDIHLADGDSFEIFEKVKIESYIIFTTAYDEYALKAFKVNSIDYLLKPIDKEDLSDALNKLSHITSVPTINPEFISRIVKSIQQEEVDMYKSTFLVPQKDKLIPVSADSIAYIFSEYKMAKIFCFNGQKFILDTSLTGIMEQLDPTKFYRANRQYIVAHSAIKDMSVWFQGKLAVNLSIPVEERIIVSRANNNDFKDWFLKNSK